MTDDFLSRLAEYQAELKRRSAIGNLLYRGDFGGALIVERVFAKQTTADNPKAKLDEEMEKRRKDFVDAVAEAGARIRRHNR